MEAGAFSGNRSYNKEGPAGAPFFFLSFRVWYHGFWFILWSSVARQPPFPGGRRTATTVQTPKVLSRPSVPPCNSTKALVSGRPRPVPSYLRASRLSTCEKGSIALARSWGSIQIPVLVTVDDEGPRDVVPFRLHTHSYHHLATIFSEPDRIGQEVEQNLTHRRSSAQRRGKPEGTVMAREIAALSARLRTIFMAQSTTSATSTAASSISIRPALALDMSRISR
ncbi:MAG: hypothetical protein FD153_1559 [Rhodospirillaceae bacterium]|nr:MAG: hypothetical protein FD153_1559 [Rhodospirillaceae bacterium]